MSLTGRTRGTDGPTTTAGHMQSSLAVLITLSTQPGAPSTEESMGKEGFITEHSSPELLTPLGLHTSEEPVNNLHHAPMHARTHTHHYFNTFYQTHS